MTPFVDQCNAVRKRVPFEVWLCWDFILAPFLAWGAWSLSGWFLVPLLLLLVAVFFDITEAIVKWEWR
jgi:hypothetical protein